jgi:hypothetical protein
VGGNEEEPPTMEPVAVGLDGTRWEDVSFSPVGSLSRRQQVRFLPPSSFPPLRWPRLRSCQALLLIQRYAYSIGTSSLAFHSISKGGDNLSKTLNNLHHASNPSAGPAFLALNDDISSTDPKVLKDVDERMQGWFREVWENPSPWERKET